MLPKLSLYIHIPWCVEKCPYCDFNSHKVESGYVPSYKHPQEDEYIKHLLADLKQDLHYVQGRPIDTIFFGGGTPSIFSAAAINTILEQCSTLLQIDKNTEITLEANPGTLEKQKFSDFRKAGINRLSIGVQSFNAKHLQGLGRIHDSQQAQAAISQALESGFTSVNVDLMHGLMQQTPADALADLAIAVQLAPQHLSWYQLTIEPNTLFFSKPPKLPSDDLIYSIEKEGKAFLASHGYEQYEVSAYARNGIHCRHNLNYWTYQDYLGIGCGAAGKLTQNNIITRTMKTKHPRGYLQGKYLYTSEIVLEQDIAFEFFMNRFRLFTDCSKSEFMQSTQLSLTSIEDAMQENIARKFIIDTGTHWRITEKGKLFLNDLLMNFM